VKTALFIRFLLSRLEVQKSEDTAVEKKPDINRNSQNFNLDKHHNTKERSCKKQLRSFSVTPNYVARANGILVETVG